MNPSSQLEIEQMGCLGDLSAKQRPCSADRLQANDILLFALAAAVCFFITKGTIVVLHSPDRGLPYADRFATSDNAEWSAYGGNWKVEDGGMVNESNERGAKLVAGSAYWKDYVVQADVALRSLGDAGILARVSDPEQGVDAYRGIYVGLRIRDQGLVIGVADHDWEEADTPSLSFPIVPNTWYHLQVKLEGCKVNATVNRDGSTQIGSKEITLDSCPLQGKIGLRSYDSGGIWKNVRVTKLLASH